MSESPLRGLVHSTKHRPANLCPFPDRLRGESNEIVSNASPRSGFPTAAGAAGAASSTFGAASRRRRRPLKMRAVTPTVAASPTAVAVARLAESLAAKPTRLFVARKTVAPNAKTCARARADRQAVAAPPRL